MEKERPDEMEMAAQENKEREKKEKTDENESCLVASGASGLTYNYLIYTLSR